MVLKEFQSLKYKVWANWNRHLPWRMLDKLGVTVCAPLLKRARPGAWQSGLMVPPFTRLFVSCCPAGAIPGGLGIGPPAKSSIDDSYGRYDLIQNSESPASPPVAVPHSWSRAKSDSDKISNGSSINWPPGKSVNHACAAADQNMLQARGECLGPRESRAWARDPGSIPRSFGFFVEVRLPGQFWVRSASGASL